MSKYILAIDVGKGTEDVVVWNPSDTFENAIQLVMPSNAQLITRELSRLTSESETPVYIAGDLMAGEPWHKVVYGACEERPGSVVMEETAARSLRYNLDQVRQRGVTIVPNVPDDLVSVQLSDVRWDRLLCILEKSDISTSEIEAVLLCCQDHGEPPDPRQSTRDFRMREIYESLSDTGKLESLLMPLADIPDDLPRLKAIGESARSQFPHIADNIFVMDSSPAVVLGAHQNRPKEIVINVGNGHTVVMFLDHGEVNAVYESHTSGVSPDKLHDVLRGIVDGELTHEAILEQGGHGLYVRNRPTGSLHDFTVGLIGPNRSRLVGTSFSLLHPGGNMMMAGPLGLIRAYMRNVTV